ncbi:hypothetical protein BK659_19355 [Pseudomonas brassicacearum]|uniref:Uncharacterized protein n=1 Tax=Pseudomonas brassicacearum TaxID=930166 RepID=A0A423H2Q5_9PSED|nr:hypothetical protein BK659_19355 [Pseudomonas brassicacearum]
MASVDENLIRVDKFVGFSPDKLLGMEIHESLEGFCFSQPFIQRLLFFCQGLFSVQVILAIFLTRTLQPIRN